MDTNRLLTITPMEVMMLNAERLAVRERERADVAVTGLKKVIGIAVNASQEWNPEIERITTAIIIEAENALREMDGRKQTKSASRHWLRSASRMWKLQVLTFRSQVGKFRHVFHTKLQSLKAHRYWKRVID